MRATGCDCICHDRYEERLRFLVVCVLDHGVHCNSEVHPFHPRSTHAQDRCTCALLRRAS